MSIAYLPHAQPPNNNTLQMRRRVTDVINTLNETVGSVSDNTGSLGALNTGLTNAEASITSINAILAPGVSGSITLAKLTGGGTNGSITVVKGIITAFVNPT